MRAKQTSARLAIARRGGAGLLAGLTLLACAHRPEVAPTGGTLDGRPADGGGRRGAGAFDLAPVYGRMGLLVGRGDLPFVASVSRFAGPSGDSTFVLVALSLTNRALTFVREGDRYRAPYEVRLDVRDARGGDSSVCRAGADKVVRVATFRETARADESVLFQQVVALRPGAYTLALAVRDANSGRSTTVSAPLAVPRPASGGLATPVVVYDGTPRAGLAAAPRLTASGRATVTFGQDSVVALYVEAYAPAGAPARLPLRITARGERDAVAWSDTASLPRQAAGAPGTAALYSGIVRLPVARLGVGVVSLDVVAPGGVLGTAADGARPDSARAALFVSLGPDLPASTFDDVLGYLRFYAPAERLRALREASPESRAAAWAAFLRDADASAGVAEREGLREYLARVRSANARFSEESTAGWLTDRGMTFLVLGEPDAIADPTGQDPSSKGRTQVWEYEAGRAGGAGGRRQITFVDRTGFGRWRLTPASLSEVQAAMRRVR